MVVEQNAAQAASTDGELLHTNLGRVYAKKVEQFTAAFEDEALRAQAFDRLRALIEAAVLTPEDGALMIELRGELAAMLSLCALSQKRKNLRGRTLGGVAS